MLAGFTSFDTPAVAHGAPESRSRYMSESDAAWLQHAQQAQHQQAANFAHGGQLLHAAAPVQHPAYMLDSGYNQFSSMYMPQLPYGEFSNQLTPTPASIRGRPMLPALNIPETVSLPHLLAVQGSDQLPYMQSSSPASAINTDTIDFSRHSDDITKSSKRNSMDSMFYCRASTKSRQRTAQACEKCRDRKTKCSGERPTCKRCADRGLECIWAPEIRIRGTQRVQQRSRRVGSGGSVDSPAAQGTPISGSTSPGSLSPPPLDLGPLGDVQSAPAAQTSFPPSLARTTKRAKKSEEGAAGEHALRSSQSDSSFMFAVNKGPHALEVMGQPVRPLSAVDDCWETVNGAQTITPGWEKAFNMLRTRARGASISVAHLARDYKLHPGLEQQGRSSPTLTSYFNYGMNDANDPSLSDSNRPSFESDDFPSLDFSKPYDLPGAMDIDTLPSSQQSDDISELLNQFKWPSFTEHGITESPVQSYSLPESIDPLAQPDNIFGGEAIKEADNTPQAISHDDFMEFFNSDAFNSDAFNKSL